MCYVCRRLLRLWAQQPLLVWLFWAIQKWLLDSCTALSVRPSIFVRPTSSVYVRLVCMTCKIKEVLIHALFCRPRSDVSPYWEVAMTNSFVGGIGFSWYHPCRFEGSSIWLVSLRSFRTRPVGNRWNESYMDELRGIFPYGKMYRLTNW